jgi:hypothetical protein
MPARIICQVAPLRNDSRQPVAGKQFHHLVRLQRDGDDHASTNVGATPALASAPKLDADLKIAMLHRSQQANVLYLLDNNETFLSRNLT